MENIVFYIAIFLLIAECIVVITCIIIPLHLSKKNILILFNAIIISFASFAFFAEPGWSTDLASHYESINGLRSGYLVNQGDEVLLIWRAILKFVSMTQNNGWLPFVCIILWGGFISRILKKYLYNCIEYKTRNIMIYFIVLFSGCSIYYLLSGIRCALVCSIIAYAHYILRNEKRITYYLFVIVACMIHIFGGLLFILIEIYERYIKGKKSNNLYKVLVLLLLIAGITCSPWGVSILKGTPIPYINLIVIKWEGYMEYSRTEGSVENQLRFIWLLFFVIMGIWTAIKNRGRISFFYWIVFATLALSPLNIFFERMSYFVGICAVGMVNETYFTIDRNRKIIYTVVLFSVSAIFLFYMLYTMFAHVQFAGHSYHAFWKQLIEF